MCLCGAVQCEMFMLCLHLNCGDLSPPFTIQIGEYMGENKEPNLTVLTKFVELFEFQKMDIVTALRAFLGRFRLPGEAQKVRPRDRYVLYIIKL